MSSHLTGLNNSAAELAGGSLGLGQPLAVRRGRGGGFAGGPLVATGLRSGRLVLERIDLRLQRSCSASEIAFSIAFSRRSSGRIASRGTLPIAVHFSNNAR